VARSGKTAGERGGQAWVTARVSRDRRPGCEPADSARATAPTAVAGPTTRSSARAGARRSQSPHLAVGGVEAAANAAGLGKVTPKDLRASFCALAGRRRVDPVEAAQLTGHRSTSGRATRARSARRSATRRVLVYSRTDSARSTRPSRRWPRPTIATPPAIASPTTFVVMQVRQALQQAGATGVTSATRFVSGMRRVDVRSSTPGSYPAPSPLTRR
jgi:hypothetical protein